MRRIGGLWPAILSLENLLLAYRRARQGKSGRPEVQWFALELENRLRELQEQLDRGSYRPGGYRQFSIYERKPRTISAAPFVDRVVQHALMNQVEPPLDKTFIHDSYACRRGKGVHRAVDRYQGWAGRYPYAMKLDIRRYFASIDQAVLAGMLARRIKDRQVLTLFDRILASWPPQGGDRGIPIGNLTSQMLANLYLDDFDHWIKQDLRIRAYLRYVDDLILLGDSSGELLTWRGLIEERLRVREGLVIHQRKGGISRTGDGVDVLGYRIWPDRRQLRNDNGRRFQRRYHHMAEAYRRGELELDQVGQRLAAWIGHARHGETRGLRRKMFRGVVFRRP